MPITRRLLAMLIIGGLWPMIVQAQTIHLTWSASPTPDVSYVAYRGDTSRAYTVAVDVGSALTATFPRGDPATRYYFAVQAYQGDRRSVFSDEAILDPEPVPVPVPDPCVGQLAGGTALGAGGGSVVLAVTVNAQACAWTVVMSAPWLQPPSASGHGDQAVALTYSPNHTISARTAVATLTVAAVPTLLTLVQEAAPVSPLCQYALSSSGTTVTALPMTTTVTVWTSPLCAWTATGGTGWAQISPASGTGTQTVTVSTARHNGRGGRSTTFLIAERVFTVVQQGRP